MPRLGIGHGRYLDHDAGYQSIGILGISGRSIVRDYVRAQDRGIEGRLSLRLMAIGAFGVVGLKSSGMIVPRGEVDIVMASSAGSSARRRQKCLCLSGARGLAVAHFAAPRIGRIDHG